MRAIAVVAVAGCVLLSCARPLAASEPTVACALLTPAQIGAATGANIGAGTIFCNYDGFFKHHTEIGEGAFVGSNTSLVAPVKIGDRAYIGSGSVITKNVPDDALALERTGQEERPGWAAKFRAMMAKRKARAG